MVRVSSSLLTRRRLHPSIRKGIIFRIALAALAVIVASKCIRFAYVQQSSSRVVGDSASTRDGSWVAASSQRVPWIRDAKKKTDAYLRRLRNHIGEKHFERLWGQSGVDNPELTSARRVVDAVHADRATRPKSCGGLCEFSSTQPQRSTPLTPA